MQLGVVLMIVGLGWFVFRKRIARRQAVIIERMLRLRAPLSGEQVRGLETVGLLFCSLLFLAGVNGQ
ncbi:hypothetical protein IV498_13055 [Paenarthrobacter sp. Z7-10]|uniref:hypothetical protein n=1 Tax=Paenarthrobacter sp. Z7-10 TaxID=2787635 RepID=UPI0022A99A08|nr:hypothetical protein [Paenarthrobacter sp. Z7-10]MCZ2404081.1 hypothetical protein [Paenarthrobacter sp. Z7-10]